MTIKTFIRCALEDTYLHKQVTDPHTEEICEIDEVDVDFDDLKVFLLCAGKVMCEWSADDDMPEGAN